MPADNFADVLVRASRIVGSLLGVARLLEVEPLQVYYWIASVDRPTDERRRELEVRLSSLI
jgi:hypothetical protein